MWGGDNVDLCLDSEALLQFSMKMVTGDQCEELVGFGEPRRWPRSLDKVPADPSNWVTEEFSHNIKL